MINQNIHIQPCSPQIGIDEPDFPVGTNMESCGNGGASSLESSTKSYLASAPHQQQQQQKVNSSTSSLSSKQKKSTATVPSYRPIPQLIRMMRFMMVLVRLKHQVNLTHGTNKQGTYHYFVFVFFFFYLNELPLTIPLLSYICMSGNPAFLLDIWNSDGSLNEIHCYVLLCV